MSDWPKPLGLIQDDLRVRHSSWSRPPMLIPLTQVFDARGGLAALLERFAPRNLDRFRNKVRCAMRFGFGEHVEKK